MTKIIENLDPTKLDTYRDFHMIVALNKVIDQINKQAVKLKILEERQDAIVVRIGKIEDVLFNKISE
jgi:hypothetical protein